MSRQQSVPDPADRTWVALMVLVVTDGIVTKNAIKVSTTTATGAPADLLDMTLEAAAHIRRFNIFDLVVAGDFLGEMEAAARKWARGHSRRSRRALAAFGGMRGNGPGAYAQEMMRAAVLDGDLGQQVLATAFGARRAAAATAQYRVAVVAQEPKHAQPMRRSRSTVVRGARRAVPGNELIPELFGVLVRPRPTRVRATGGDRT
jgi:hypothetical protein